MQFVFVSARTSIVLMLVVGFGMTATGQSHITQVSETDEHFKAAVNLFLSGEFDESIPHFKTAERRYRNLKNHRQVVSCYMGLTNCYFFKGNYAAAMRYSEKALALHTREVKDDQEGLDTIISTQALCRQAMTQNQSVDSKAKTANADCCD